MTLKKYQKVKLILTVFMAVIFSQSIVLKNYLIPITTLIIGSLFLILLRHQVKEVMADERDYALAGKSASWAIQIYSWVAVVAMLIFYAFQDLNPAYAPIAMTLAYSTCFLMLVYSLIFKFQSKAKFSKDKNKFIVFAIILAIFVTIFTLRFFSGEDNWVCQNGQWVEHGHPDFPAPKSICK